MNGNFIQFFIYRMHDNVANLNDIRTFRFNFTIQFYCRITRNRTGYQVFAGSHFLKDKIAILIAY